MSEKAIPVPVDAVKYRVLQLLAFDFDGEGDVAGILDAAITTYLHQNVLADRLNFLLGKDSPFDDMEDPDE